MNKADEKALAGLHGMLAEVLTLAIKEGLPVLKDDGSPLMENGKVVRMPAPAAILNVARQFLKDNKIEAISTAGSPLHTLADLPVFEDDNIVPLRKTQ